MRLPRLGVLGLLLVGVLAWNAAGQLSGGPAELLGRVGGAASTLAAQAGLPGLASAIPSTGAGYQVTATTDAGAPLRWRSCGPVPYLVNAGPAGPAGVATVRKAFARVSKLTGVQFRFAGLTTDVPTTRWAATDARVPGYEFAPVLVGFVTPAQTDMLAADQTGATVANPAGRGRTRALVTGAVALRADTWPAFTAGFGAGQSRGNLVLHELGHLVGLDHVSGAHLMNPIVGPDSPAGFDAGDRAGLAALAASCRHS